MNGDVGKQYCGVCPPSTPDTPSSMAVESPVEAPASSSSSSPTGAAASTASLPSIKASVPEAVEEMAAAAQNSEPEGGSPDGNSEGSVPFVTSQQNGEVTSESGSQTSASLLPTPPSLPSPVTSSSDPMPEDSGTSENQGTQGTQTTPAQTPTSLTPSATPVAQPHQASQPPLLTRDQIQQLVAQQVEYFFSRENLTSDPYLISQMDSDQYVPVFILANCSQFKNITKDHSIIVEALKESPYVQLDEDNSRVRPNYKRCIVILREIPESTPVEEIEAIFNEEECPRVVSCEFVHNSSWYVTFESDEDAQKAYWYLRGTVQTFKGKPILARIKTKPISRLGCLSVLPSYGGKGGNEGKEGTGPPSAPGSAGLPAGPGTPQQQNANFNPTTGQRFMYSPPTSVNANSYPPTYTMPTNMPTAFFYPNMVQWTAPGNFFDMSSFLQYNGLSPQAAFKPPTTNHVRYNQNRRNNKRDGGRYDKDRHNGNPGGGTHQNVHMAGHYHSSPRPYHRPQASQSPSLTSHRTNHPPPPPPNNNGGGGPPPPPPPTPPPPSSHPSTPPVSNHLTFAQCDLALASQSDLYTSFSPPINRSTHVRNNDKSEALGTLPSSQSGSSSNCGTPASSTGTTSVLNSNLTATTVTPAVVTSVVTSTMTNATPTTSQQPQQPSGPPPPPPHRGNFGYHQYIPREPQPPRQLSRGGRRRPRGRDDETMSGSGRSMPQRGMASQPSTEKSGNNQESTPPPPPPPQFDLQATAFPPLPGADEQVPVAEEKRPTEPLPSLWGSDTQRFSDVMKGTAKPRPSSQSSIGEKDSSPPEPTVPSSTASTSPPCPIVTATPTVAVASTTASQITSTTSTSIPSQSVSTVIPVSSVNNTTVCSSAVNTLPSSSSSSSNSQTNVSCNKQIDTARPSPREQQRGNREDRRLGASGGYRERRDYTRDHQRDYQQRDHPRDMLRTGNVREYHRLGREGSLRSGGKENRPVSSRQWKEEKADADGWITKGPREPARSHREVNRDHREKQETRTALVNGESSPPPSPKTPKTEAENTSEEKLCSQSLNNNDGEHKPSWAKMALASKDHMERLAAELKEKEEHEKKLKHHTRPQAKPQEKVLIPRERDGKPLRRDGPPRENRLSSERGPVPFRPRDSARPKSPK